MRKVLITVLAVGALAALVTGCSNGGAQEAGPVPTVPETGGSTSTGQSSESSSGSVATTPATPLCADQTASIAVASQQGAAGTIRTVWRVKNTSATSCHSFGYPGMDFRSEGRWLDVRVHRGGFADINQAPSRVVVAPGHSLYFVSYWGDVDTAAGPCKQFDRVKVTLPDNFVSAKASASGCVDSDTVRVGPVTTKPTS